MTGTVQPIVRSHGKFRRRPLKSIISWSIDVAGHGDVAGLTLPLRREHVEEHKSNELVVENRFMSLARLAILESMDV